VDDQDEAWLQRRDAAVETVRDGLSRKLKRALQDDQNEALDRLRNLRGRPTPEAVLPPLAAQVARFQGVARPFVATAASLGAGFLDEHPLAGGAAREAPVPAGVPVDELAGELASAIALPLRERLERALADGSAGDTGALGEPLGAAYREWKTQRVERLAADHANAAFVRGALASAGPELKLRWVVDDEGGPCPDCDDNALAGPTARGEVFPTGQPHPPAHAGCRCILVPAPD